MIYYYIIIIPSNNILLTCLQVFLPQDILKEFSKYLVALSSVLFSVPCVHQNFLQLYHLLNTSKPSQKTKFINMYKKKKVFLKKTLFYMSSQKDSSCNCDPKNSTWLRNVLTNFSILLNWTIYYQLAVLGLMSVNLENYL